MHHVFTYSSQFESLAGSGQQGRELVDSERGATCPTLYYDRVVGDGVRLVGPIEDKFLKYSPSRSKRPILSVACRLRSSLQAGCSIPGASRGIITQITPDTPPMASVRAQAYRSTFMVWPHFVFKFQNCWVESWPSSAPLTKSSNSLQKQIHPH